MRSPSVILWCQTCYRYFAKYTRCISAGCVIPSIFPINYFLLCPKWRPTPRGNHYCPSHRMEQSKKYHNGVDSNFPSMMIFFTLGGLSQQFQIIFFLNHPASICQCHWMVVCVKRLIRGRILMEPSSAFFISFLTPFQTIHNVFFFCGVCVKRSIFRGFSLEASRARETTWC